MKKLRVGILGATGMVGQRFVTLLHNHPWFDISCLAASSASFGKMYKEAVKNRWKLDEKIPDAVKQMSMLRVVEDKKRIAECSDFVFSALDMEKEEIRELENTYASLNIPVVSNNSAHRWTQDVPMIIPEVNPEHMVLIDRQRKNHRWEKGFVAVKPNCSIQSYVAILTALKKYKPQSVLVTSMQAISGAGKTFVQWPEMIDNVIPFIKNEEEKSEKEPQKIWGKLKNDSIIYSSVPKISATCIRVPVTDGHMASVAVSFEIKPTKEEIMNAVYGYENPIAHLNLPSAPQKFITYFESDDRPQTGMDRNCQNGMGIEMGRLRPDTIFDWKFVALSHNTIRGAAGGAILLAELLKAKGYL
jgi:aspartate-semialdehyde dehydrogenase